MHRLRELGGPLDAYQRLEDPPNLAYIVNMFREMGQIAGIPPRRANEIEEL